MTSQYKRMTDFLVAMGIEEIPHTQKTYMGHLIAVYRLMQNNGCTEEVCQAGMFHSIYGTELFQGFKLELNRRDEVRVLIGARAERLAYVNCAMDRESLDQAVAKGTEPFRFRDRITGEPIEMNREDLDDLCRVHLYDFLEQVARGDTWDYRRPGYRRMAERLGEKALAAYDWVFAQERAVQPQG